MNGVMTPIFMIGTQRSGSNLLRLMMNQLKDISSPHPPHILERMYGVIYDLYAQSQSAKTWCCKSMANINFIGDIEEYFNHPKYIYLYRDGRDVAVSFQKAVVGEKHIYNIAKEWAETQAKALNLRKSMDKARFHSISYEQLTQQPEVTARSLCDFLNTDYVPAMLDFHKTSEARNAAESSNLWGNVTSPILQNNSKKYLNELSYESLNPWQVTC